MSQSVVNPKHAFVTLVTTDAYVIGAQVLAKSLRETGSKHPIICLVTGSLSPSSLRALRSQPCFSEVRTVQSLDSNDRERLALLGRPELGCTFTKIHVWNQLDLEKVVFMDADMIALKNIDELFERDELSAVPDVGWPDCFNSGLFVCRPNATTYQGLLQMANAIGSFDGGDQGLLNQYFSGWSKDHSSRRLPFGYNLTFSSSYSYLPAFQHFRETIKVIHFIGSNKPWTFHRLHDGRVCPRGEFTADHLGFVQRWWSLHDSLKISDAIQSAPTTPYHSQHSRDYHVEMRHYSPPKSPVCFGSDGPSFANYKICWSSDIESHFSEITVQDTHSAKSPESDRYGDFGAKIAYKKSGRSNGRPSTP